MPDSATRFTLFQRIRKAFQPWYRTKVERGFVPAVKKNDSDIILKETDAKVADGAAALNDVVNVKLLNYPSSLADFKHLKQRPSLDVIWCYHDANEHSALGHFGPDAGYRFKTRSGAARAKLKPRLYPRLDGPYDRTHLIPIGYHGSEQDDRLLVGWSPLQNQGPMNEFEQQIKRLKQPIYWLTLIQRDGRKVRWRYMVYDVKTLSLLKSLDLALDCDFVWYG